MEKGGGGEGLVRKTRVEEAVVGAEGLVNNEGGDNTFPRLCWCRGKGMAGTTYGTKRGNRNKLRGGTE